MQLSKDIFNKSWIIKNSIEIIQDYNAGELTVRALHYQLVGRGMHNTTQHYKRVCSAMESARWSGQIDFETFSDLDRSMLSTTRADETDLDETIEYAKTRIEAWMNYFFKNRWENQPIYPEVWIEKKALLSMFQSVCDKWSVALGAVKGYPSLTFLNEASKRFIQRECEGKKCVILYFGDYDPSGEDIPRSLGENLTKLGAKVDVQRKALSLEQVRAWNLPAAPTKSTDSRSANWDGIGQVELDAAVPRIKSLADSAIKSVFDQSLYEHLMEQQKEEAELYRDALKKYVQNL